MFWQLLKALLGGGAAVLAVHLVLPKAPRWVWVCALVIAFIVGLGGRQIRHSNAKG